MLRNGQLILCEQKTNLKKTVEKLIEKPMILVNPVQSFIHRESPGRKKTV